jgi:hypothetical protein
MRSDKHPLVAMTALVAVSLSGHADVHAQLITLGQALNVPAVHQPAEPAKQKATERPKASVHLNAIYGLSDDLRVSVYLNGLQQEGQVGRVLKSGATSCRITRIELPARCIGLAQASRGGDMCPAMACWTGESLPSAEPQTDGAQGSDRGGRELGMPPTPVPHPAPARKQP